MVAYTPKDPERARWHAAERTDRGVKSVLELSWAAGFFDGEGSFFATSNNRHLRAVALRIAQVRREPLDRFRDAVGLGRVDAARKTTDNPKHNPVFVYQVQGSYAVLVMQRLLPHLSLPKLEQYERAMVLFLDCPYVTSAGPPKILKERRKIDQKYKLVRVDSMGPIMNRNRDPALWQLGPTDMMQ